MYFQYKKQLNGNFSETTKGQPKSTIEKYFTRSPSGSLSLVLDRKNPSKRLRSPESSNKSDAEHLAKRLHQPLSPRNDNDHVEMSSPIIDDGRGSRDDNDWIGPYGI